MREYMGKIAAALLAAGAMSPELAEAGNKHETPENMPNTHEHNDEKKDPAWKESQIIAERLNTLGAQEFINTLSKEAKKNLFVPLKKDINNPEKEFVPDRECLACIDEGVDKNKLALAGSGILFPAKDENERLNRVADMCIQQNVLHVTSHAGCGAAKMAWEKDGKKTPTPDEYGQAWAKKLSAKIAEKTKKPLNKPIHIQINEMSRPKGLNDTHNARTAWVDMTNTFNPNNTKELPKGFLINHEVVQKQNLSETEKEYPFTELKVAIGIAFSDHGFGNKFTVENPFIVVVVGKNEQEMEDLQKKMKTIIENDEKTKPYADKIKIDGFVK